MIFNVLQHIKANTPMSGVNRQAGLLSKQITDTTLMKGAGPYRCARSVLTASFWVFAFAVVTFAVPHSAMSWEGLPAPKDPEIFSWDIGICEADGSNVNYSFAIIGDPHVGKGVYDYGYRGLNDYIEELPFGFPDNGTRNLYNAVNWISDHVDSERIQIHNGQSLAINGIKFVAEVGDLTQSGEPSEQGVAMKLLDSLPVPWLPVVGNHDLLPYTNVTALNPFFHLNDKASSMKIRGPCTVSLYEHADYGGLSLTWQGPNDHDIPFLGAEPYGPFSNKASSIKIEACGGEQGTVALYDQPNFEGQYTLFKASDSSFKVAYEASNEDFDALAYNYYRPRVDGLSHEPGFTGLEIVGPETKGGTTRHFLNYAFDYAADFSSPIQFLVLDFASRARAPGDLPGTAGEGDLFKGYTDSGPYHFLKERLSLDKPTVILAHYIVSSRNQFHFTFGEDEELINLLCPYKSQLGGWFGGHGHINWEEAKKCNNSDDTAVYAVETAANYIAENGLVRVVRVCQKFLVDPGSADLWLDNFAYDQAWRVEKHIRLMADVNGDGKDDVVGFGDAGVGVALSTGSAFDNSSTRQPWNDQFGYNPEAGSWRVEKHPRTMADVNGDGKADVVGFGDAGVGVALSTGSAFDNASTIQPWVEQFGYNQGWDLAKHVRLMADVNGDGMADVVGFKDDGVWVSLSTGVSFESSQRWIANFGYNQGWDLAKHVRLMADVNGDGMADVVGFGDAGVGVALSTGSAFDNASTPQPWLENFGYDQGWTVEKHERLMADVNGDGMADVVGFGDAGVEVALSTGSTFDHSTPQPWNDQFGYNVEAGSWRVDKHPRMMADLDGNGKADVAGFGDEGVGVALSTGLQFFNQLWADSFGYNGHWVVSYHPRMMADVNGDGKDDAVGFGDIGVYVILSDFLRPLYVNVGNEIVTVDEGQTAQNSGTIISDPAGGPATVVASVGIVDYSGDTWSWSFTTSDGPTESQTVTISASDASGNAAVDFQLVVHNVAPAVGAIDGPVAPVVVGAEIQVEGSFVDPGLSDTHTAVWTWGDGTVTDPADLTQGPGSGVVKGTHAYLASGQYAIVLNVTDNDGGQGVAEVSIAVQSPFDATNSLIEQIEEMEYLDEGIENALLSKLKNAQADLGKGKTNGAMGKLTAFVNRAEAQRGQTAHDEDSLAQTAELEKEKKNGAVGKLQAFINSVEAQRGKAVLEADADALVQTAQEIINAIENGLL